MGVCMHDFLNILLNADEFKDVNFTICILSLTHSISLSWKGNLLVKIMQIE